MALAAGGKEKLEGEISFVDAKSGTISFTLEKINL